MTSEPVAADLLDELSDVAMGAATAAAQVVRSFAGKALSQLSTKSSPTDLVSEADRASEEVIASYIRRRRPHDPVQGEEGTALTGTSEVTWVADPLDGTTNFYFQIPAYSVSLAARWRGRTVAGVVVDCGRAETWWASLGRGAYGDGVRCTVASGRSELGTALVATGFGYQPERRRAQGAAVAEILPAVRDIRRLGSAALDLCWVAAGRYDAFYELGLNDWDWAAGRLICEEAGGRVEFLPEGPMLATTPELFGPLAALIGGAHRSTSRPSPP